MSNPPNPIDINVLLVEKLIAQQFPEFVHLGIKPVKHQGHDNRTFRLGSDMSVRMPTAEAYALKVPKEQQLLPYLAPQLTVPIPIPLKMGQPSEHYPFHFSIYKWLDGECANSIMVDNKDRDHIAKYLAQFLQELQNIDSSNGPAPGLHNWWRGDHVSVYDKDARTYIAELSNTIDSAKALKLWEKAIRTTWLKSPVWIHGDFASSNILIKNGKLAGVIDFGGLGVGDPACDLVIAWTFLSDRSREIFKQTIAVDTDTWLRAKAWALWKATYELCKIQDKSSSIAAAQIKIIHEVLENSCQI